MRDAAVLRVPANTPLVHYTLYGAGHSRLIIGLGNERYTVGNSESIPGNSCSSYLRNGVGLCHPSARRQLRFKYTQCVDLAMALRPFKCLRCNHEWASRMKVLTPVVCPKCRSLRWNLPKNFNPYRGVLGKKTKSEL